MIVDHLDAGRRSGGEPADYLSRVRRIRNQERLVRRGQVGDEIVDHTAGVVTAQRVLGLARCDPAEVVGQAVVHELRRSGSAHPRLAEVGYIEQSDGLPYSGMLAQHTAATRGVFNGHLPAAEVGELGC
jgi:hypothetical protein